MSFAAAVAKVIEIVVGSTPGVTPRGLPAKYRHDGKAHSADGDFGDSRSFWVETRRGAMRSILMPSIPLRQHAELTLYVWYRDDVEKARLQDAIMDDYDVLLRRLFTTSLWGDDICNLAAGVPPQMAPYEIQDVDGGQLLVVSMDLEFYTGG